VLGSVMMSEAPDRAARIMIGWTIVNRMRQQHVPLVASAVVAKHKQQYSTRQPGTNATCDLARQILTDQLPDSSQGATNFYTPATMPREGESTVGNDVKGGLEQVRGVKGKDGRPARTYRPRFAARMIRVQTPSIPEAEFKFYK
jgi:hypothetical protein